MKKEEKEKLVKNVDEKKALVELGSKFSEAEELLKDKKKTEDFLKQIENKLKVVPKVGDKLAHLPILIALVRDYIQKKYTTIPLGTIIAIISALIYFLTPIDLIPDAIVGAGFIDDALVLAACLELVHSDVDEYQRWRDEEGSDDNDK